ncbi:MAG: MFS transporter [Syntrophales bacterium]|nr:MFS transporter [Syntrophales bacterium]
MIQDRIFYGWVIVAVSFINLGIIFGIWYSFSVFLVAVIEEFQWSRSAVSGVFSCFMLVHSFVALPVGSVMDRFGPRRIIPLASCLVAVGLAASSRITSLWHFYLSFGVITAIGVCAIGFIAHGIILPKWFERKRGLAIGIAMSGIGLGMQIIIPLSHYLITLYGWRSAYLILAAGMLSIVFPLNAILQRTNPGEIGEVPDGSAKESVPILTPSLEESSKVNPPMAARTLHKPVAQTPGEALRTRQFWFLFVSFFFVPLAIQGTLIHQVASVIDGGFSAAQGAFFFGMAGIFGSLGKIFFGTLSDRISREKAFAIGMFCTILGVASLLMLQADRVYLLYSYAILFGMGYGSIAPIVPARSADLFLGPHFGKILGILSLAGGIGGASGVLLSGKIFDLTEDYTLAFIVAIVAVSLAIMLFWFSSPPNENE